MRISTSISIFAFLFLIISGCGLEKQEQSHPMIHDHVSLLSQSEKDSIAGLIRNLEQTTGSQVAVIIVDSLDNETIEQFSLRTADQLALGRRGVDDGVLISVVLQERTMRIEVGIGLENIIKDEIAARILREEMTPSFKERNFGKGICLGISAISDLIIKNRELIGTTLR